MNSRGAERRRAGAARSSSVELTPLIDVVFLLLIFFMVSSSFARESVLDIVLAEAQGAPATGGAAEIRVAVSAAGEYAVDGQVLADTSLAALLDALGDAAGGAERPVVVAADAEARHDAVMRVLDAASRAGLTSVRVAVRTPAESADQGAADAG